MAQGSYSRLYWCFADEFPLVFGDDHGLATFVRLLQVADGTYPAPAPLPRNVKRKPLQMLIEAGLILLEPGENYYRVKGLAAERQRRTKRGKDAADQRWQGKEAGITPPGDTDASDTADAPASAERMPGADADTKQTHQQPAMHAGMPRREEREERESTPTPKNGVGVARAREAPTKPLAYRPRIDVAWPGRPPVPGSLHAEFRDKLGGDPHEADAALRAWYPIAAAPYADQPIGDDDFGFWRARFREWVGTTARVVPARVTPADTGSHGVVCPHDPPCRRTQDCIARYLEEERQARQAATA